MRLKAATLGLLLLCPTALQSKNSHLSAVMKSFALGFSIGFASEKLLTNTSTPKEFLRIRDFVFELGVARLAVDQQPDHQEVSEQLAWATVSILGYALGTIIAEHLK